MTVTLRPVTRQEFSAVVAMAVAPGQEGFVASNLRSLAQSAVEPEWTPLVIAAGEAGEELVGFAMFGHDEASDQWWIIRFMIDAAQQGRGYGKAALRALLDLMVTRHGCRQIYLGYEPDNVIAAQLYARAGFVPTGEIEDGEIVARLDLAARQE